MLLFDSKAIQTILAKSVLLLDSGTDVPLRSDVVQVVFKGSHDYDPCVRIVTGCEAAHVTRITLLTLDLCKTCDFPGDLIGVGGLGDERLRGACQHPSEVIASVIWNLMQYQQEDGSDVVHVDACQHAVAGTVGYTIVVHQLFDENGYAPHVSLVHDGECIYTGDPANIVLLSDKL